MQTRKMEKLDSSWLTVQVLAEHNATLNEGDWHRLPSDRRPRTLISGHLWIAGTLSAAPKKYRDLWHDGGYLLILGELQ